MGAVGQVIIALVVPVAWGLLSAYLFDRFRQRREKSCEKGTMHEGAGE